NRTIKVEGLLWILKDAMCSPYHNVNSVTASC
ncbi:MAG: hypothetical protein QOJ99_5434, partial [Bryobacterales bacterium]|nr:hypothetical protein [Bryobacterales bacterium]